MKRNLFETISYIIIVIFILGIFYYAFYYQEHSKESKLEKGEIVEDEKTIKKEIIKEVDKIEDELREIEGIIG